MKTYLSLLILLSISFIGGCGAGEKQKAEQTPSKPTSQDFNDYWYQGKAEVCSYDLQQARYGEIHDGHAAFVFVTEDFWEDKHLKVNNPDEAGDKLVKILKLNTDKKFVTGIYPYSMMQSVFTPVDLGKHPRSLRVTTSSQEWCGHTFNMMDYRKGKFEVQLHSYFESEGDKNFKLDGAFMEDEIWTRIRIDHKSLPTGDIQIIPSALAARLSHRPQKVEKAEAELLTKSDTITYKLTYKDFERELKVHFEKAFPHKILGWEETYISGFGSSAKKMTTTARLKKTLFTDYWSKNANSDEQLRKELGLPVE